MNSATKAKLTRYRRVMREIEPQVATLPEQPVVPAPDSDHVTRCRRFGFPSYLRYRVADFLYGCEWRFWPGDQQPPDGWKRDNPNDTE